MKKIISLATTILLFMLATALCVCAAPTEAEMYSDAYGELIYFEDFEDGSTANAYATMGGDAFIWTAGNVVDNPVGEGKAFISTAGYLQFKITGNRTIDSTAVTLSADILNYDSATTHIQVAILNDWLDPWDYWTNDKISKTQWTTKSVTVTKNVPLIPADASGGNLLFYLGGNGMYFDNIKVYAKYDLGNNIRLIDNGISVTEVTGDTFTFPEFKTATKNFWVDEEGNQYMAGESIAASECIGKTYTAKSIDFVEYEEVLRLNLSASAITTDKGTVTITPEISYVNGVEETDFSGITYSADTVNATIQRNADHSITVTGQINGEVTITAHLPETISNKLTNNDKSIETTIKISGQPERIVSSTFKVMMFGNSIRKHEPNASLNWTGNWGMAASAEDKDYAHRFIHHMNEKYGQGVAVLYDTTSIKSFEDAFANKDENADYTSAISAYIDEIKRVNPDIVTLQYGDNAKNITSAAAYKNGTLQLVEGIREAAPNAIIVLSTPFFGGGYHVDGTIAAGEETDIPVALIHKLYTYENLAKSENSNLASGVDIHPGDRGMDNIAKEFFALVDAEIVKRNCLEYATIPSSVEIQGESLAITTENGTLKLSAGVLPADAPQDVIWTIVSENASNFATIDEDGKLSAINNGTVTVRATSRYNENAYDEADVTISGQSEPFTVTYNGNADNATVPEANEWAKPGFRLDNVEYFASRPGYKFLGWALEEDSEVVDALDEATTDTTVYAQWTVADSWDFEREGYKEDFTFENAFHQKVVDGSLSATATDTSESNVLKIKSPTLILDSEDYYCLKIRMRNTEKASDTTLELTITAGGNNTVFTKSVTSVDYVEYLFDLSGLSGTITGFEIAPTNVDCTIYVDSIEFVKTGTAEYTPKPADYSASYGNLVYFDNFSGEDFGNTADIIVAGPGAKSAVYLGKYAKLNDNTTFSDAQMSGLVIKAANGESFKYTDGRTMNGNFTLVYEIYNGTSSGGYKFYYVVDKNPGGWDSWGGFYTAWSSKKPAAGEWTTITTSASSTGRAAFGHLNSNSLGESIAIASVALYFKPTNAVNLVYGDETVLVDVNEMEQYTLPLAEGCTRYTDEEENVYLAGSSYAVTDIIGKTLTASFVESDLPEYTVSFEGNKADGSSFDVQTITQGECATNPGDAYMEGYTFLHWSLTENGAEYDFGTSVTGDITLYAVFEKIPVKYTVAFVGKDANGNNFNSQTVEEGNCATNPGDAYMLGYVFKHWSLEEDGAEYNFSTHVTGDITLYAVYELEPAVYTEKPVEYSENYGNLVYFDNFSGEDFGNTADIIVAGPGAKSAIHLGKYARLNDATTINTDGNMSGIVIKAANGESFEYTDGRTMNGTFTLVFELYNGDSKNRGFNYVVDKNPGEWSAWGGYYTSWSSKTMAAGEWTTITVSASTNNKAAFGYLDSHSLGEKIAIASVALYFNPNNKATFIDGDNKTLMDLEGLTSVVMPMPSGDFNSWSDGNGNVYKAGQAVTPADIKDATLTAVFTADPYSIDSISLLDADFNTITAIPDESFFVEVEVTNVSYNNRAIVLIASYDEDGRMIDIDFLYANPTMGQTVTFGAQVNNSESNVAKVKAFVIADLKKFNALTEAMEITK